MYDKSPLNYTGNKYKQLPQLLNIFPKDIDIFYDLFTGGGDVIANVQASERYANDFNPYLIDILKTIQSQPIEETINYIENIIKFHGLTQDNKEAYLAFREYYNQSEKKPLDLFILICFAFSNMMRMNSEHEFNQHFGRRRFNPVQKKNLQKFYYNIQGVEFSSQDFRAIDLSKLGERDFVYADPPYLITKANYNTNSKEAFAGWSQEDDLALFNLLDTLDAQKVKWALSNVFYSRGESNDQLIEWSKKYRATPINSDYTNVIYNLKNKDLPTVEVIITNYEQNNLCK